MKYFNSMMRAVFLEVLCLLLIAPFYGVHASPPAQAGSGYDIIAAVNSLRAANGLPAYQVNGALIAAAQGHSDYMAASGTLTHTGRGGSNANARAVAAGYGKGAKVYVSENIAGGNNMSAQRAVQIWQGDNLHLNTMLGGAYTDAGAGMATSGEMVFYTLDVGYVAGSPGSGARSSGAGSNTAAANAPQVPAVIPVQAATPQPDGSIVHTVQTGQALWNISAIYKVSLDELITLNKLGSSAVIHPGDKILVKPPQVTLAPSPTYNPEQPTATVYLPTQTPAVESGLPMALPTSAELAQSVNEPSPQISNPILPQGFDPLLALIGILVVGGVALLIMGSLLRRAA